MAELLNLVASGSNQFSSDLAEWLASPKRPTRPFSRRFRNGIRNSASFAAVVILLVTGANYALTGVAPGWQVTSFAVLAAGAIAWRNWATESAVARKEEGLLLTAHWERHRAYLQRRRVWARLRYCAASAAWCSTPSPAKLGRFSTFTSLPTAA